MSSSSEQGASNGVRPSPESKPALQSPALSGRSPQSTMSADDVYQQALVSSGTNRDVSVVPTTTQVAAQPVPSSRLMSLPLELKLMVMRELETESQAAMNMAVTSKELRDMALARYWSVIQRDRSIRQLLTLPSNVQQLYVNLINELRINGNVFTNANFRDLRFNGLEKLEIDWRAPRRGNNLEDISSFIGPHLRTLSIKDSHSWHDPTDRRVTNFFPVLTRAPGLRRLDIDSTIDAGPQDLLNAFRTLPRLEEIRLFQNSNERAHFDMDHELLRFIVTNARIKVWSYQGDYSDDLVLQALEGIPPKQGLFLGLSELVISLSTQAASHLLPRLHSLKSLSIFPKDEGDILDAVVRMSSLESLYLYYVYVESPLTTPRLGQLSYMHLKELCLVGAHGGHPQGSVIALDDFSYIFGSYQTLETLELDWRDSTHFYEGLGGVFWRLAKAYPNLKTLKLPKASLVPDHFEECSAAGVTAWPSLTSLTLLDIMGPRYPSHHQEYLNIYAHAIHNFFPSLTSLEVEMELNEPYVHLILAEKRRLFG
ncbi:hypothetical protein KCU92_g4765, partial [Aureobasidium melanogenum]